MPCKEGVIFGNDLWSKMQLLPENTAEFTPYGFAEDELMFGENDPKKVSAQAAGRNGGDREVVGLRA